jgi:heme O synthase-like polyprenyltransferase
MIEYEYIYISFIVSVVFFIMKQFLYKKNPIKDQTKMFFKESVYLFCILLATLYAKDYYFKVKNTNTEIFIGDPSF